jgi:hypothetical protein
MDLNTLRASRNQDFSKITSAFDSDNGGGSKSYEDNRLWKLDRDKAGNATAVIRFLPRVEGDELPWVKIFSHGFKGPTGKWYIENSLTTIGKQDPVGELNTTLWNSGSDANKEIARSQKRRLNFISNIVVVSDPVHPENNGKVMLFKYGKKIFDMIMNKAQPTFEDEKPVNVFDLWEGANFKIRMRTVEGYPNYDQSAFAEPTPVAATDEAILAVVNQQYKLSEFLAPSNFKSYEELKAKLDSVLSGGVAVPTAESMSNDPLPVTPPPSFNTAPAPTYTAAPAPVSKAPEINDDDEFDMSFFQKIANE